MKARFAGADASAARVEGGVLVEWDQEGGVLVAEDVATAAAVVAAGEVSEGAGAGGGVAVGGVGIWLSGC